jgi:NADPH:quinone reductase-like Zn-dependent oxidoreductase
LRQVTIYKPGGHDRLALEDRQGRDPGPGEVAIDVDAIGVNYADCLVRMGLYRSAKDHVGWPICPGFEVAGRVAATGPGAHGLASGERVFAVTLFGAYATRVVVPREQVFAISESQLTQEEMAGFPAVFLTAWYGLHRLAHPRGQETALVHSAAGGVGGALVQLLKVAGCRVVGVVGAGHKVEFVRDIGADAVIDKSSEDLWSAARRHAPDGYGLIFDANGAETLRLSYAHLATPGKLVVYGFHTMLRRGASRPDWLKLVFGYLRTPRFNPLEMTNHNKSVLAFNLSYLLAEKEILAEAMAALLGWLAEGRVRPLPVTTFPFEEVAAAHRALESGETVGKLVLRV